VAVIGDPRDKAKTTVVVLHDLLGFGDMVAASGGTFDSAVGAIAFARIGALRESINSVHARFPAGTTFFHFNDTLTAHLDVDIDIGSSHTDATGIGMAPPRRTELLRVIQMFGAAAALHQGSIAREDEDRIGAAGRTFVVMGKRWELGTGPSGPIFEIPHLQANLAFAEAHLAEKAGSGAGFSHRSFNRLYVNDLLWFTLVAAHVSLTNEERGRLDQIGLKEKGWPSNLLSPDAVPVKISLFHRERTFFSMMSHHALDLCSVFAEWRTA
jgi:hypothetical protein